MSRLLHVVFLIVATLGFCLTAQQLHNVNHLLDQRQIQQDAASGFVTSQRPTSVQDAPPAAQAAETSSSDTTGSLAHRDASSGDLSDDSQPRPTRVKTPAAETVLPTNTKVPVMVSGSGAAATTATSLSDPGFLALAASLGLMTLGMALV
ncbi:hypothetical protein PWT90_05720 [Aphanocladium album]|nr:hypothetical protein PWT90_05720 [Aphanocladium album]